YTKTGYYYDTLHVNSLLDSIVETELFVIENTQHSISTEICQGDTFNQNGKAYYSSGVYRDTFQNYMGCDSILTLNLKVNIHKKSTINANICFGDTFQSAVSKYTTPGKYFDTLSAASGCDSIVILNLEYENNPD